MKLLVNKQAFQGKNRADCIRKAWANHAKLGYYMNKYLREFDEFDENGKIIIREIEDFELETALNKVRNDINIPLVINFIE